MRKPSKQPESGPTRDDLTEVEWTIMKVVWDNEPCTAGTVKETLQETKGWAYSTVKTTMDRMVKKGILRIEKIRNLQLFHSCISDVDARKGELRKMLKRAFDGALTPMMQFLFEHESLSQDEIQKLRDMVNETHPKNGIKQNENG